MDKLEHSPLVSICIPVFNCEKTLEAAIRSILNQTFGNWELLLMEDGSNDRTLEVARSFPDSRISVLTDHSHRGLVPRLNQAVTMSRGEYFARMDADDVAYPERLERQTKYLRQHPETDLLGCGMLVFKGDGVVVGSRPAPETHEEICLRPSEGFYIGHPTWMGRTRWFRAHPYDVKAALAEDQVLLLRSYSTSCFACLPEILYGYREDRLVLGKILRSRYAFATAVFKECSEQQTYFTAIAAVLRQLGKASLDILAVTTGLNYLVLAHRARSVNPADLRRWAEVWFQVKGADSFELPAGWQLDAKEMNSRKISVEPSPIRVVNIVTSSLTVRFLEGQPEYFKKKGLEVILMSSPGEELSKAQYDGVQTVAVPMAREISPWSDLVSLWRTWRVLWRLRPAITNVATPKAGLLGGIAAWLCRIPIRYYTLLGLRCETTVGLKRKLLLLTERVACLCAHRVICVSESLKQKAIDLGVVDEGRTIVLGSGGFRGVDEKRFAPTAEALRQACQLRQDLGIPQEAPVVGFVGRLTRDKGIAELVDAYSRLRTRFPKLRLLLVGDLEEADPLPLETLSVIQRDPQIIRSGFVKDPIPYYRILDVLAFPTHREGFGNAAMEAHAVGKPVVATWVTGIVDSVIDGVTGILVPVGDVDALAGALELVLADQSLAAALGSAGRERALREFRQERIWEAIVQEYSQQLRDKGLPVPSAAAWTVVRATVPTAQVVSR